MTVIPFDHKFDVVVVVFISSVIPNVLFVKHLEERLSDLLVATIGIYQHKSLIALNCRQFLLGLSLSDLVDNLAFELLEGYHHDLCACQ